jgi:hypothetical protein
MYIIEIKGVYINTHTYRLLSYIIRLFHIVWLKFEDEMQRWKEGLQGKLYIGPFGPKDSS